MEKDFEEHKKVIIATSIALALIAVLVSGFWLYLSNNKKGKKDFSDVEINHRQKQSAANRSKKNSSAQGDQENINSSVFPFRLSQRANLNPKKPSQKEVASCYIKSLYLKQGKKYMDIDDIEYFEGKEATKAINEENKSGEYGNSKSLKNGFYVRNKNPKIRTLRVSDSVKIIVLFKFMTNPAIEKIVSFNEFKKQFEIVKKRFKTTPFNIEINNDIVIKINQQYIP